MERAIHIEGLSKKYGETDALNALDLSVEKGTVFGFLGPNGAGKTTTIRLLLGLIEPSEGKASVLGHDVSSEPHKIRELSGALLEHNGLYERLSVLNNLELYSRIYHLSPEKRKPRISELLMHFDLWDRRNESAGTLSKGMKQKLAIARTLLHRPQLVFLDEPTNGLDPNAAIAVREELRSLVKKESMTVFLTTHNLDEAERVCDQVAIINEGRLQATGGIDDLRRGSGSETLNVRGYGFESSVSQIENLAGVSSVKLTPSGLIVTIVPGRETHDIVSSLISLGAVVEEAWMERTSLEEVFAKLTGGGHNE